MFFRPTRPPVRSVSREFTFRPTSLSDCYGSPNLFRSSRISVSTDVFRSSWTSVTPDLLQGRCWSVWPLRGVFTVRPTSLEVEWFFFFVSSDLSWGRCFSVRSLLRSEVFSIPPIFREDGVVWSLTSLDLSDISGCCCRVVSELARALLGWVLEVVEIPTRPTSLDVKVVSSFPLRPSSLGPSSRGRWIFWFVRPLALELFLTRGLFSRALVVRALAVLSSCRSSSCCSELLPFELLLFELLLVQALPIPSSCHSGSFSLNFSVPSSLSLWWPLPRSPNFPIHPTSRSSEFPTRTTLRSSEISDSHDLQVVRIPDSPDLFCSRSISRSAGFPFRPTSRSLELPIRTTSWSANFRFVRPLGRHVSVPYDLLVGRITVPHDLSCLRSFSVFKNS